MGINYAKQLPMDRSGNVQQGLPPAASAIGTTSREAGATASSVTGLTVNTTAIEVAAIGSTGFIKWTTQALTASVVSGVGGANYDNVIPKDTYRRFVVPRLVRAQDDASSTIAGLNTGEGLFNAVATMTAGVGSILLIEV